jgi:hypothetical protein
MKLIACFTCGFLLVLNINFAQEFADAVTNPFSLTGDGNRSSPCFIDLDNDGDLDMLTGLQGGDFGLFDNIGSNESPSFGDIDLEPFLLGPVGSNATPFLIDLDNDGDYDVFSGSTSGFIFFENFGDENMASFITEVQSPYNIISPTGICRPYFVDIDNDGDPDLFSGSTDGNIYYYEYSGTLGNPEFEPSVINAFGFSDVGIRSAPSFVDIDEDGDFDAFVGEKNGDIYYFENIGNAEVAEFDLIGMNLFGISYMQDDAKPFFVDIDDDSDLDLIVGGAVGDYYYFENLNTGLSVIEQLQLKILIYPNPASDRIFIENKNKMQMDDILIYNQLGQQVFNQRFHDEQLDISSLEAGIYIIEVIANNTKYREKLVIQ